VASRTGQVRVALARRKFDLRVLLAQLPVLYHAAVLDNWWQVGRRSHVVVHGGTELVMDGFQSSANSYSIAALRRAERRHTEVAHHLHCPQQVLAATRRGIPVLLLIREPRAAVLSLVSRWPELSVRQGLRAYTAYYRRVLPAVDACVVGPFKEVIADFGGVMRRVNDRFGTDFPMFTAADDPAGELYRDDESRSRRRAIVDARRPELDEPGTAVLLAEAEAVYERVMAFAGPTAPGTG
jgi:hypothetical protein